VTDTANVPPIFGLGRKPPHPPGHPRRLALPWLHELDSDVAPGAAVVYPVDLTNGITEFPMWGNGPDPTLTIDDAEGQALPVGNCDYAGKANLAFLDGNPESLTSDIVVNCYDNYEADVQGVHLGQEQDDGVVMSDSMVWCLTHKWDGMPCALGEGIVYAFVPVQPDTAPAVMAKYRKPLLMGVNLTGQDQQTFPKWSESPSNPPDPSLGHVVVLALLHAAPSSAPDIFGPAGPLSWTQVVEADEPWMNTCPEEFWLPVTPADRDKMGAGVFDTLVSAMSSLPGFQGENNEPVAPPATPPTPANPPPAPPPPPPARPSSLEKLEEEVEEIIDEAEKVEQEIVGDLADLSASGAAAPLDEQGRPKGVPYSD
jgi:hypothetical protein